MNRKIILYTIYAIFLIAIPINLFFFKKWLDFEKAQMRKELKRNQK